MKKLLLFILILFSVSMFSQVGINTTTPAAQLEIVSSNQATPANTDGIIIPKIDAFPATNPTALQQSMMVYLTTVSGVNNPGFYYWNDATSTWVGLLGKLGWEVSGNAGTVAGTNYIGTSDNIDVSIKANALERIRINSGSGNIGFNTPTPEAQLQITASNQANPSYTDGIIIPKIDIFPITNPTAAQQCMMVYLTTAAGANQPGFYYWDNVTVTWKSISGTVGWGLTGNAGTIAGTNYIGTTDANDLVFDTNAIERMRIKQTSGNVGIGVANPLENLQVANNIKIGTNAWGSALDDKFLKFGDGNLVTIGEEFLDDSMSFKANRFFFNNGNVGIGVTTPFLNRLQIGNPPGFAGNDIAIGNGVQAMSIFQSPTASTFFTNTNFAFMPASGTGNVGIGITNPTQKLHVVANSPDNPVIYGVNTNATAATTSFGVRGESGSTGLGSAGVSGVSINASQNEIGVVGDYNLWGAALFGLGYRASYADMPSTRDFGLFATCNFTTGTGVYARDMNNSAASYAIYGTGRFSVTGVKAASVPTTKGNQLLYCTESPEIWFEDLGGGKLTNGTTHIALDEMFLETVFIDQQHKTRIFLQEEGESNGLIVFKDSDGKGFTVKEKNGGNSNIDFSYRIMAKRRFYQNQRFGVDSNQPFGDNLATAKDAPMTTTNPKEMERYVEEARLSKESKSKELSK
jgi:hypothetical protein